MNVRFKSIDDNADQAHDSGLCEPQLNILAHAQVIELDVGSQCGGHGLCGADRIQILEENRVCFSAPTAIECEHLSSEELKAGFRLACQTYPEKVDVSKKAEYLVLFQKSSNLKPKKSEG